MEMKKSVLPVLLLLLLLVATPEMTSTAEARTCESQSHQFKGRCFGDHNCGMVCRTEGFFGGNCRGLRGKCFCTKPC